MSKKLVALSFFKTIKIDYYLDSEAVNFPCFFCLGDATMDFRDTYWKCTGCQKQGTLKDLIQMNKREELNKVKNCFIYNPRKERNEINKMFSSLLLIKEEEKENEKMQRLQFKVNKLISYLLKNKK